MRSRYMARVSVRRDARGNRGEREEVCVSVYLVKTEIKSDISVEKIEFGRRERKRKRKRERERESD